MFSITQRKSQVNQNGADCSSDQNTRDQSSSIIPKIRWPEPGTVLWSIKQFCKSMTPESVIVMLRGGKPFSGERSMEPDQFERECNVSNALVVAMTETFMRSLAERVGSLSPGTAEYAPFSPLRNFLFLLRLDQSDTGKLTEAKINDRAKQYRAIVEDLYGADFFPKS